MGVSTEQAVVGGPRDVGSASAEAAARPRPDGAVGERLYLAGRPSLQEYVRHQRRHALSPLHKSILVEEWNAAHARIRELEREEAGIADAPPMERLAPEHQPLLLEFLRDPLVQKSFNTVPCDIALVELDRLVVYQRHIDLTYARALQDRIGPAPDFERVFRTCLPLGDRHAPVQWSSMRSHSFVFVSPSNDLRFLGAVPVAAEQLAGVPFRGAPAGIVGLSVGFGSNFLNAIYVGNRLILNNGSHRAYALRALGVTHVPCIVQHVSSRDELDVVGSAAIRKHPEQYLWLHRRFKTRPEGEPGFY